MRDEFNQFMGDIEKITKIRNLFNNLLDELCTINGLDYNSRELSIVKTKLEEASMYAIKCHCKNGAKMEA